MMRNIFAVLSVIGCAILIPICVIGGGNFYDQYRNIATLMKFTPQYIGGGKFWAYVLFAYLIEFTVCGFIWWNYRAVYRLRRTYFESAEYKASLHSRTLLVSKSSFSLNPSLTMISSPTFLTPREPTLELQNWSNQPSKLVTLPDLWSAVTSRICPN
jgi:hypothetical protein